MISSNHLVHPTLLDIVFALEIRQGNQFSKKKKKTQEKKKKRKREDFLRWGGPGVR